MTLARSRLYFGFPDEEPLETEIDLRNSPNKPLETELDGWDVGKNTHAGPRTLTMSDIAAQHAILTVQHDPSFMKSGTVWASSLNAR